MLKLKELHLSGIGRFVDEQTINFDNLGPLIQVDGQNNNTGGSSGSGKSTVFNALDFLFGLNYIPNTVLKSRLTDDGISVKGTFDYDGKSLIISRGKKLSIEIDGEITTGSSKITEEKLDEIIAIPRDLFRPMIHKRQKEGGFFLNMGPKDINDFLMNCLNLGHFKTKIDLVDNKSKSLYNLLTDVLNQMISSESALRATQDAMGSLTPPPDPGINQTAIDSLKDKAFKSKSDHDAVLEKHKIEKATIESSRPQITAIPFDRSTIITLENQIDGLKKQIADLVQTERVRQSTVSKRISELSVQKADLNVAISKGERAQKDAVQIAAELNKIRASVCPTCEQSWATEQAKVRDAQLMEKLVLLKNEIVTAETAKNYLKTIVSDIENLNNEVKPKEIANLQDINASLQSNESLLQQERQKEKDHQNSEATKNRAVLAEFATLQSSWSLQHSRELEQARGQLDVDSRALEAAISATKAYGDAKARHEISVTSLKTKEVSYQNAINELTNKKTEISLELEMVEELKRALKGYVSCSFDDALEDIGENATKLIRSIPNMANARIQLEGIKETKDGKIKEEVNAVIHMDGEESVPIKSLSGGERSSVDLAIDLSVVGMIQERSNKGANFMVLDEPFNGLDSVSIEMVLEVLKNSNVDKKLILVDHNEVVKQMIGNKIIVERNGDTSRIIQP